MTVEIARGTERCRLSMPAADAWVVQQVFEQGEYVGVKSDWLTPSPTVVDIGAHCGVFALYSKWAFHKNARVHCFEPYPPHVELLRRNVARLTGVTVHPVGLGKRE